jgi:hypothetical protein
MLEENTYDEIPSGRVDTLVKAIERIERLENQLKIAVEALESYSQEGYYNVAQRALFAIKELENAKD